MRTLRSLLVLSALALTASACAAPLQSGGVVVRPGVEARLDVMCRYHDAQAVCASLPEE